MQANGVLVIDKPSGPTSHDIVQQMRQVVNTRIGHTGTLDPMATGVLILLLGRATRLARFLQPDDKEYLAEIKLGETTPTLDREGEVLERKPVPLISRDKAKKILAGFTGDIQQSVPLFSAVKVRGERLYDVARRKGGSSEQRRIWLEKTLPRRTVSIYRLEIVAQSTHLWTLEVHCSKGTYIRTLAHDLGQALGCGAHLHSLRRTRSGRFDLQRAASLEKATREWNEVIFPMEDLLPELPRIDLDEIQADRIRHGAPISWKRESLTGFCRLFFDHALVAVGDAREEKIHPKAVLDSLALLLSCSVLLIM